MAGFIRKLQHGATNKSEEDTENEGQGSNKKRYEYFHKANWHLMAMNAFQTKQKHTTIT